MRDKCSPVLAKLALSPRRITTNGAVVGTIIDTAGYEWAALHIQIGAITDAGNDATFTVLLEDGDNAALADASAVADVFMISQTDGIAPETAASWTATQQNQVRKLEYIGPKRYIRLTVTAASFAGTMDFGAMARLGSPQQAPVTQTPS